MHPSGIWTLLYSMSSERIHHFLFSIYRGKVDYLDWHKTEQHLALLIAEAIKPQFRHLQTPEEATAALLPINNAIEAEILRHFNLGRTYGHALAMAEGALVIANITDEIRRDNE